jgi:hypothetical protein
MGLEGYVELEQLHEMGHTLHPFALRFMVKEMQWS